MSDNLQEIVDEMRDQLRRAGVCAAIVAHPELAHPLVVDIIPDGINSIVRVRCGDRIIADTAQRPEFIINELYTFLRACLREAISPTPAPKPS